MTISSHVRLAELGDIEILLGFAKSFHKASPYKSMGFDAQKGRKLLEGIIQGSLRDYVVLVALKDQKPVGFLVGAASQPVFSSSKIAMELGWWIEPEARGSRGSYLIFKAYEDWALRVGCSYVQGAYLPGVSTSLDKFYQKQGYVQVESSYMKRIKI